MYTVVMVTVGDACNVCGTYMQIHLIYDPVIYGIYVAFSGHICVQPNKRHHFINSLQSECQLIITYPVLICR